MTIINFICTQDFDEICVKTLKGYNGNDKLNILSIGMTRNNMILITNDFYVYEIKRESMNIAINTLNLNKKPIHMSEIYPKLYESKEFNNIKQYYLYNSITIIDSYNDWLCYLTWKLNYPNFGLCYSFNEKKLITGWNLKERFNEITFSSTIPGHFYSIRNESDTNLSLQIAVYKTSDIDVIQDKTQIKHNDYRSLCFDDSNSNQIRIMKTSSSFWNQCKKPIKWLVKKGFVANGRFYLFSNDSIYSFNEIVYNDNNEDDNNGKHQSYPFEQQTYQSFFKCIGDHSSIITSTTTNMNSDDHNHTKTTLITEPFIPEIVTTIDDDDHDGSSTKSNQSLLAREIFYIPMAAILTVFIAIIIYFYCCYNNDNQTQLKKYNALLSRTGSKTNRRRSLSIKSCSKQKLQTIVKKSVKKKLKTSSSTISASSKQRYKRQTLQQLQQQQQQLKQTKMKI